MGVISSRAWRFAMTRTAGAFAPDTNIPPDLALTTPGLWMIEWYAFARVVTAASMSVTLLVRDGPTTIYQYATNIGATGGAWPGKRIMIAVPNGTHTVQVETNSGIVIGDTIEVCKGVQLLGALRETQALGFIDEIDRGDLLALRGWW